MLRSYFLVEPTSSPSFVNPADCSEIYHRKGNLLTFLFLHLAAFSNAGLDSLLPTKKILIKPALPMFRLIGRANPGSVENLTFPLTKKQTLEPGCVRAR